MYFDQGVNITENMSSVCRVIPFPSLLTDPWPNVVKMKNAINGVDIASGGAHNGSCGEKKIIN